MAKEKYIPLMKCPWCESDPVVQPWHGGGPEKVMISCENDECDVSPSATGETLEGAAKSWNRP